MAVVDLVVEFGGGTWLWLMMWMWMWELLT
jgi:hypothetical protein